MPTTEIEIQHLLIYVYLDSCFHEIHKHNILFASIMNYMLSNGQPATSHCQACIPYKIFYGISIEKCMKRRGKCKKRPTKLVGTECSCYSHS